MGLRAGPDVYRKSRPPTGTRSPDRVGRSESLSRPNCVRWHIVFVGPQYGTCFMSPFWLLEF